MSECSAYSYCLEYDSFTSFLDNPEAILTVTSDVMVMANSYCIGECTW